MVVAIVPPARAAWFDLTSRTERLLEPGDHDLRGHEDGFLWVDVDLPAPAALEALAATGLVPAGVAMDDEPPGRVGSQLAPDHLHLRFAVARLDGDGLVLDRYALVVSEGAVVSLHTGLPAHFDDLRAYYGDDFRRFARSHGFLLFEMMDYLADGLGHTVRALGDRIDDLRMTAARSPSASGAMVGSELLASVLVIRRVLARTRDLLAEISSRRSPFVPETTQPFLRDIGDRLDGFVADLAFSRDVLDEALRLAEAAGTAPGRDDRLTAPAGPERAPEPAGRPALAILSLGGFEVRRGGVAVPPSEMGGEHGRELLAALLSARRPVEREQLLEWLWPEGPADRAPRALGEAVASLRHALGPGRDAEAGEALVVAAGRTHRLALGPGDSWDVDRLLGLEVEVSEPSERIERLEAALEVYGKPFCPEWPHAEWGRAVREDCARALAGLSASLAEALVGAGRLDEAIARFEALLEGDPENEPAHRGLMRCHAQAGRMPLALRQYHACRSILRQTQGVDPGSETQRLYLELLGRR